MTSAVTTATETLTPVHKAIRAAARATGIGFDYLVTTAERESNLNPLARANSSSAGGLFQFVDSTWLGMLKERGAAFGYAREAEAIRPTGRGSFTVDDPAMREHIMNLRFDPQANALMAGVFTQQNNAYLETTLERAPTQGELYIAHFLGPEGAGKFITQTLKTPTAPAAFLFPKAASANRPIFYEGARMRSMNEVYTALVAQHRNVSLEAQQIASADTLMTPVVSRTQTGPLYRNLFTPGRTAGVSPIVTALWTRNAPETAPLVQIAESRKGFFPMTARPEPASATRPPVETGGI